MTSRELFKKWKEYIIIECSCDRNDINELEQIERDLEVLGILKNYVEVKPLCLAIEDIFLKGKDIVIVNCEKENDFNLIKEWLENVDK